jgi:hypothetical protein
MVELRAGQLDPRIATSTCCLVTEFLKYLELCTNRGHPDDCTTESTAPIRGSTPKNP